MWLPPCRPNSFRSRLTTRQRARRARTGANFVEAEAKEPTGVTRGQNAVHVVPLDWSALGRVLSPLVERIDVGRAEPQMLVVTADAAAAAAAAEAIVAIGDD